MSWQVKLNTLRNSLTRAAHAHEERERRREIDYAIEDLASLETELSSAGDLSVTMPSLFVSKSAVNHLADQLVQAIDESNTYAGDDETERTVTETKLLIIVDRLRGL